MSKVHTENYRPHAIIPLFTFHFNIIFPIGGFNIEKA